MGIDMIKALEETVTELLSAWERLLMAAHVALDNLADPDACFMCGVALGELRATARIMDATNTLAMFLPESHKEVFVKVADALVVSYDDMSHGSSYAMDLLWLKRVGLPPLEEFAECVEAVRSNMSAHVAAVALSMAETQGGIN